MITNISPPNTSDEFDFNESHAFWFSTSLTIIPIFNIPAHLFLQYLALYHTPKDMFNYKCTVSNTTIWSTLVVVWYCLVLRPIPLFPYPVGISLGPSILIYNYQTAMLHFQLLMLLSTNCVTAMIICFFVLITFVLQSRIIDYVTRRFMVVACICYHLVMTSITLYLLNVVYVPDKDLVDKLSDTSLHNVVNKVDGVFFGYVPNASWPVYSFLIFIIFFPASFVFVGLTVYTLVKLHNIMTLNHTRRMKFRWNSAVMLASRTLNPVLLLIVPLVICCYMIFMNCNMFTNGLLLAFLWAIHGLANAVATISVFRPYRHVVKSAFCRMIYKEKYVSSNSYQRTMRSTTEAPIKSNQIGTISNTVTLQNDIQNDL